MASRIVRLERLESRVELDNPFASLTDSELLVLIGTYADTYPELAEEPEIIELDEQERRKAEFDTRPDAVAAVATNVVAAGWRIAIELPNNVRWPHLVRSEQWLECAYSKMPGKQRSVVPLSHGRPQRDQRSHSETSDQGGRAGCCDP
jgi:hypothetical protein